jgi:hypothetical protein
MRHLILPSLVLAALTGSQCRAQQWPVGPDGPFPRIHPGQTELPPGYPPVNNAPSPTPLKDYHRYGRPLGCWASFNGYTCSSLPSTWTFIFGSCRDFYGEPCLKGPPPSPLPDWANGDGGRMPPRPYAKAVHNEYWHSNRILGRLFAPLGHGKGHGNGVGSSGACRTCAQP